MRVLHMFSVLDLKAEAHMQPFFMDNEAVAIRAFGDQVKDPTTPMGMHPEDYVLYSHGLFKVASGVVLAEEPTRVCSGVDLVRVTNLPSVKDIANG